MKLLHVVKTTLVSRKVRQSRSEGRDSKTINQSVLCHSGSDTGSADRSKAQCVSVNHKDGDTLINVEPIRSSDLIGSQVAETVPCPLREGGCCGILVFGEAD